MNFSLFIFLLLMIMIMIIIPPPSSASASASASAARISKFREAPQFYNGPPLPSHVAMTLDSAYLRGSIAAVHSVQHSSCPQSLHFHFHFHFLSLSLPSNSSSPPLSSAISSSFPSLSFSIHLFDPSLTSSSLRSALDRPLSYARSYLPQIEK